MPAGRHAVARLSGSCASHLVAATLLISGRSASPFVDRKHDPEPDEDGQQEPSER